MNMDFILLFIMALIFTLVWMSPLWIIAYIKEPYMKRWCWKSLGVLLFMLAIQFYCMAFLMQSLVRE